jgi:hypothetical protein
MRGTIAATAAALLLLSGCGGGDDEEAAAPLATPTPQASRCETVPAALLAKLNSTLTSGASMKAASAVKSGDFEKAYFVAGAITGPGLSGKDKAVFVTNDLADPGLTFAVGGFAHQFSDLGHGEDTKSKFSQSDDGYEASQDCL